MESAGFDNGVELLVGAFLVVSIACGALIAKCILGQEEDSETKQARKALADVLNDPKPKNEAKTTTEDDMFDVPLNDARTYVGPDNEDVDILTSNAHYTAAPSKPAKPSGKKTTKKSRSQP